MSTSSTSAPGDRIAALRPLVAPDLVARRIPWRGVPGWVLHNPVSGRYARAHPRLHALLARLDGRRSVAEAMAALPPAAPDDPDDPALAGGVAGLLRLGLLRVPGARAPVVPRPSFTRRLVYWRIDLGDLAPALPLAGRVLGPLFSPLGVALWCATVAAAVALWLPRQAEARASFAALAGFTPLDALSLFLLFGLLKLVHELGHAVCAQRVAVAEGHRIGVFRWGIGLMFLMPAPWVDVSGTWFVASRWRRAAVGLAGIWVDLFMAALATILWAFAEPGAARELLFHIALVCGASSLLFNANPLVRLDGYYVVSDLLEIPALQARATAALRAIGGALVGLAAWPRQPGDWAAAAWGSASFLYRLTVFVGVFWLARSWHWLLGIGVAAVVGAVFLAPPLLRALQALRRGGRRAAPVALAGLALAGLALLLPLPDWVTAEGVVEREGTIGIFARADGVVAAVAEAGPAGTAPLVRLTGPETLLALQQLDREAAALAIEARQAAAAEPAKLAGIAARGAAVAEQRAGLEAEVAAWRMLAPSEPAAAMVWAPGRVASLAGAWVRRDDARPLGHAVATEGPVLLRVELGQRVGPLALDRLHPGDSVPVRGRLDGPAAFAAELLRVQPQASAPPAPREGHNPAAAEARSFEMLLRPPAEVAVPWRHGQRIEARVPLPAAPLAIQLWRRARQALETRLVA